MKRVRKLKLSRETIRNLQISSLRRVAGGASTDPSCLPLPQYSDCACTEMSQCEQQCTGSGDTILTSCC